MSDDLYLICKPCSTAHHADCKQAWDEINNTWTYCRCTHPGWIGRPVHMGQEAWAAYVDKTWMNHEDLLVARRAFLAGYSEGFAAADEGE